MTLGLAFWVIWLILVIFLFALRLGVVGGVWASGLDVLVILLITLMGWQVFGPPLRR